MEKQNDCGDKDSNNNSNNLVNINPRKRNERSKFAKLFGRTIIFLTIVSCLFVGIFINLIQVLLLFSLKLGNNQRWRTFHKRLNGYLTYTMFAPIISILYCWSKFRLNMYLDDLNLIEEAKEPLLAIIVPNHSNELDYMICFMLADQMGNLGCYKSMSKNELKYLPILGWGLWMSDIVFVKRSWEEDKHNFASKLNELLDYDQTILGIFAEGTRWTPEKYQASIEFAKSRNRKYYKHHLIPRSRGFNYALKHFLRGLKRQEDEQQRKGDPTTKPSKPFKLLNLQMVMPDKPNFKDFLDGQQLTGDIYCEEVPLSDELYEEILNSKDDDDCPRLKLLMGEIFERKDQLVDEYKANNGKFVVKSKRGGKYPFKVRKLPLLIWLTSFVFTYSALGYLVLFSPFAGSTACWSSLVVFVTGCVWMFLRIEQESKALSAKDKIAEKRGATEAAISQNTATGVAGKIATLSRALDRHPHEQVHVLTAAY